MLNLILGNIFSFLSSGCSAISAIKKKKTDLIYWQIIDIIFFTISCVFLNAYAALITSLVALLRNILAYKNKLDLKWTILLTALCIIIGFIVNNAGIFGILAIIASAGYTVFMYTSKTAQQMRYAMVFNLSLWFIHNCYIQAYPSALSSLLLALWALIQTFKNHKTKPKKTKNGRHSSFSK